MSSGTVLGVITLATAVAIAIADMFCSHDSVGSLVGDRRQTILRVRSNHEESDLAVPYLCPGKINGLAISGCDNNNLTVNIIDMFWVVVRREAYNEDNLLIVNAYCVRRNETSVSSVGDNLDDTYEVSNVSRRKRSSLNVNETLEVDNKVKVDNTAQVDKTAKESNVRRRRRSAPKKSKTPKRDKKLGLDKTLEVEVDKTSEV